MIHIGSFVKFRSKMFGKDSPYYPYYEKYLGYSNFKVEDIKFGHVKLNHPTLTVDGLVHKEDLVLC